MKRISGDQEEELVVFRLQLLFICNATCKKPGICHNLTKFRVLKMVRLDQKKTNFWYKFSFYVRNRKSEKFKQVLRDLSLILLWFFYCSDENLN